jgi:hypothetical protein
VIHELEVRLVYESRRLQRPRSATAGRKLPMRDGAKLIVHQWHDSIE